MGEKILMASVKQIYKIGTLARECGVSPQLLRAWERRYTFLQPQRGEGGQRLFGNDDLRLLLHIVQAIKNGVRIGELAAMGRKRLLLEAFGPKSSDDTVPPMAATEVNRSVLINRHLQRLVSAAEQIDGPSLQAALAAARMELGLDTVVHGIITHAMRQAGSACLAGTMGIAGEHLISGMMQHYLKNAMEEASQSTLTGFPTDERDKGGSQMIFFNQNKEVIGKTLKPVAICCCFPGEEHSIGLLTVAYALTRRGWHVVFLGPSMPLAAVEESIQQIQPESVWLSVSDSAKYRKYRNDLAALAGRRQVRFIIGGLGVPNTDQRLDRSGCMLCPPCVQIPEDMDRLTGGAKTQLSQPDDPA